MAYFGGFFSGLGAIGLTLSFFGMNDQGSNPGLVVLVLVSGFLFIAGAIFLVGAVLEQRLKELKS